MLDAMKVFSFLRDQETVPHEHECPNTKCRRVWRHSVAETVAKARSQAECDRIFVEAHKCPACGTVQTEKRLAPQTCAALDFMKFGLGIT